MSWPQVVGTFLTGTARGKASEGDALNDAAMLASMRRAGFAPPTEGAAPPEAAPAERLPAADGAEALLRRCFDEQDLLVTEWCRLAARGGWRAPDAVLPELLEFAAKHRRYAEEVWPVLGERGRWLAARNPHWAAMFTVGPTVDPEEARQKWEEGTVAERRYLLNTLADRDPALRRELVESTWKSEPAKVRTEFVEAFREGLGPEDEPFLTQCLTDRSTEVRYAAAQLLGILPGSPVGDEVFALAQEFIRFDGRNLPILGRPMTINPPEKDDARLDRFGIASIKGPARDEERLARLTRLLGLVPPRRWEAGGEKPASLLRQIPDGKPGQAVREGLTQATRFSRDSAWAEALAEFEAISYYGHGDLVALLPREAQERLARATLKSRGDAHTIQWRYAQFAVTDKPWSREFTREFLDTIRQEGAARKTNYYLDSYRLAPIFMDLTVAQVPDGDARPEWQTTLDFWRRVLDLRRSMHAYFERSPKP